MAVLILVVVGGLIAVAVGYFLLWFIRPYLVVRRTVLQAIKILDHRANHAREGRRQVIDLEDIEQEFAALNLGLAHLWQEFRHTLHAEYTEEADQYGQPVLGRYRQTVPAEVYFSTRTLVEVPLRTEFFRHLPGVLTGLGIIGTFVGLIHGLAQFDISGNPDRVNESVKDLIGAVRTAFFISAVAITCSIVVTAIEKQLLARLQGMVQRLQQTIDGLFDAGAGEDYLSDIAERSEQSATHLAHLKEGLVNDLKHLLDDFGSRQSSAMLQAADAVSRSVTGSLAQPLERMSDALERSLEDQQQAVQHLLDHSLERFARHLEDIVGAKLNEAAGNVAEAAGSMRAAMSDLPVQVSDAVRQIREALADVAAQVRPIAENAERLVQASDQLAASVAQSAETVDYALGRLRDLGQELAGSLASTGALAEALATTAREAQSAASGLQAAAGEFDSARDRFSEAAAALSELAANTQRDAEAQARLVQAVEKAAAQLSTAQGNVDAFLSGLADALAETHEAFSREINGTLDRTHDAFHQHLANATQLLAGTVNDFGEFLENDFKNSVDNLQREFNRLAATGNGGTAP